MQLLLKQSAANRSIAQPDEGHEDPAAAAPDVAAGVLAEDTTSLRIAAKRAAAAAPVAS
jgi:hypothetical protein